MMRSYLLEILRREHRRVEWFLSVDLSWTIINWNLTGWRDASDVHCENFPSSPRLVDPTACKGCETEFYHVDHIYRRGYGERAEIS